MGLVLHQNYGCLQAMAAYMNTLFTKPCKSSEQRTLFSVLPAGDIGVADAGVDDIGFDGFGGGGGGVLGIDPGQKPTKQHGNLLH